LLIASFDVDVEYEAPTKMSTSSKNAAAAADIVVCRLSDSELPSCDIVI
jgi:hypothetical protein